MFKSLKLLVPAIIPSWRFFDEIAPSPRIQYRLLNSANEQQTDWQAFRPRPAQLSFLKILVRMLWNPIWNESLFMVSCAERIMEQPNQHSEDEILKRIKADLIKDNFAIDVTQYQFRLMIIRREDDQLIHNVVFESRIESLAGGSPT